MLSPNIPAKHILKSVRFLPDEIYCTFIYLKIYKRKLKTAYRISISPQNNFYKLKYEIRLLLLYTEGNQRWTWNVGHETFFAVHWNQTNAKNVKLYVQYKYKRITNINNNRRVVLYVRHITYKFIIFYSFQFWLCTEVENKTKQTTKRIEPNERNGQKMETELISGFDWQYKWFY